MNAESDRTVHAFGDTAEVVRYDRSGKWWIESKVGLVPARQVPIREAVGKAIWLWYHDHGSVNFDRPGGHRFNQLVRQALAHTPSPTDPKERT